MQAQEYFDLITGGAIPGGYVPNPNGDGSYVQAASGIAGAYAGGIILPGGRMGYTIDNTHATAAAAAGYKPGDVIFGDSPGFNQIFPRQEESKFEKYLGAAIKTVIQLGFFGGLATAASAAVSAAGATEGASAIESVSSAPSSGGLSQDLVSRIPDYEGATIAESHPLQLPGLSQATLNRIIPTELGETPGEFTPLSSVPSLPSTPSTPSFGQVATSGTNALKAIAGTVGAVEAIKTLTGGGSSPIGQAAPGAAAATLGASSPSSPSSAAAAAAGGSWLPIVIVGATIAGTGYLILKRRKK